VERAAGRSGAEPFLRQLAWRDFFHQLLAARPEASRQDYRRRRAPWNDDPEGLAAWREGRTGIPLVDAGMRQLAREGWMHNRARLVVASFLTKHLSVDWRLGAAHFAELLVDGDVAQNSGNWQWAAGTGADTRPNRILNPVLQARRYDPDGAYVRRWVEELADASGPVLFEPWRHGGVPGYPAPLVDLAGAASAWRRSSAQ
jgi:deoxyribodipyrimidine photo-lyase